ncbi:MAG: hypothetical protein DCC65_13865 [Planctomycetota bacterium]|nr:MAG: hypothetical protein DCC65_13865 [Planctomycetota bacterium]
MGRPRKHYSGAEKMAILREHLIEHTPISEVCARHNLQPTVFYQWHKKLFELLSSPPPSVYCPIFDRTMPATVKPEPTTRVRVVGLPAGRAGV